MSDKTEDGHTEPNGEIKPHPARTKANPAVAGNKESRYEKKSRLGGRIFREWVTIVISFLTLIAVVWYASIAEKQRREMVRSNEITQAALAEAKDYNGKSARSAADALKTTRDQLASFQAVEGASLTISRPTLDAVKIALPIENHGRVPSPRVKVFVHISRVLSKGGVPFGVSRHELGGDRTLIPPGAGRYGVTVPHGLRAAELEQIGRGEATLWVGVTLRFDNGFGAESQPGFCWRYGMGGWDACPTVKFADLER